MEGYKNDTFVSNESLLDALALLSGCGLLVFDHDKHNFLYVSPNIWRWYGIEAKVVKSKGYGIYAENAPIDDSLMLHTINVICEKRMESLSDCERRSKLISYDFRFYVKGKIVMINHRIMPLSFKNGKLLLSLCFVSLSFSKTSGHVVLRSVNDDSFYEYNFSTHLWMHKTSIKLSDKEKHLLHLIARGFTSKEIAEDICKSEETVKAYRKAMKKKLGAPNCMAAFAQLISEGNFLP